MAIKQQNTKHEDLKYVQLLILSILPRLAFTCFQAKQTKCTHQNKTKQNLTILT